MTPASRTLHTAQRLLDDPKLLGAATTRSVALLTRLGLEDALSQWLSATSPGAQTANFTVQLHCLHHLTSDTELAETVSWTWAALSEATHFQGYESAPRTEDVRAWLEAARRVVAALEA